MSDARCAAPVTVSDFFPTGEPVAHRECVRLRGHQGPHRWQRRWEGVAPADVEAELARDAEEWDSDDERVEPRDRQV
jgi:hypothetical protein